LANLVAIEKGLGPEGRIAVVRFDRGDGINALSPEALRQLTDAARSFEDDGDTSVVVLTGGANAFSAGFDLKDAEGRSRRTMDIGALRRQFALASLTEDHKEGIAAFLGRRKPPFKGR
jgi:enoyl-CoA hydratase